MPRVKSDGEKKTEYAAAKVTPTVKGRLAELMEQEDRTESYILNVLIEFALAAIDGGANLFERGKSEPKMEMTRRPVAKKSAATKKRSGGSSS
jgi:hypothetical protein